MAIWKGKKQLGDIPPGIILQVDTLVLQIPQEPSQNTTLRFFFGGWEFKKKQLKILIIFQWSCLGRFQFKALRPHGVAKKRSRFEACCVEG